MSAQDASLSLKNKFSYKWNLANRYPAKGIDYHGTTVMSTFACGGGSTMGYKLAGYDVVAANDIDPQMAKVYKANHDTKQYFLCGVKELLQRDDLPQVDLLDGSPPCSLFSTAGIREKGWQQDKKFREGQAKQILDDLFFDFIDLAEKMKPKVVIAENVKGMLIGNAKWYTREVVRRFSRIGYKCQVFLLNSATMGVPQRRERVFFIAHKSDANVKLIFNEPSIRFKEISDSTDRECNLTEKYIEYWKQAKQGDSVGKFVSKRKENWSLVPRTVVSGGRNYHPHYKRELNDKEISLIGSWPLDYDFQKIDAQYLIGMSVPPVMMAQVADQVYNQLIKSMDKA